MLFNRIASGVIFRTGSLLLLAALMIPAGFTADRDRNKTDNKANNNHQDAFTPGAASESRIAREVRHELVTQPFYGVFDDLAYRVDGSVVTLLGATANPTLKSDCVNSVKHIEGVTKVNDQIDLLPVSPNDDQIRRAEYRAIYGDQFIGPRYGIRAIPSIHIIVKNGHVTLEGVVANKMDAQLVYTRANGVPGVFSVDNNLRVEKP